MERFWEKVDKSGECWEWKAGKLDNGYGVFWLNKKNIKAHRASMMLKTGEELPKGVYVCHTCDNKGCVNPDHLYLGTPQSNMDDKVARGRVPRGKNHSKALVFDFDQIISMRESGMTYSQITEATGCKKGTLGNILTGKHWCRG